VGMTWSPRALIQLLASTLSAGCSNGDGAMSTASIMPPSSRKLPLKYCLSH